MKDRPPKVLALVGFFRYNKVKKEKIGCGEKIYGWKAGRENDMEDLQAISNQLKEIENFARANKNEISLFFVQDIIKNGKKKWRKNNSPWQSAD